MVGKGDIYRVPENVDALWKIVAILIDDLENKNNQDESEADDWKYSAPVCMTVKEVSDKYIYSSVFVALNSVIKLSIDFDDNDDLLSRLAIVSCQLHDKVSDIYELKKPVLDLIAGMYDSHTFSKYLDDIPHPVLDYRDAKSEDDNDTEIVPPTRALKSSRKGTAFMDESDKTKAAIFGQKLSSIPKFAEMKDLMAREFEKMVLWFAEFSQS